MRCHVGRRAIHQPKQRSLCLRCGSDSATSPESIERTNLEDELTFEKGFCALECFLDMGARFALHPFSVFNVYFDPTKC